MNLKTIIDEHYADLDCHYILDGRHYRRVAKDGTCRRMPSDPDVIGFDGRDIHGKSRFILFDIDGPGHKAGHSAEDIQGIREALEKNHYVHLATSKSGKGLHGLVELQGPIATTRPQHGRFAKAVCRAIGVPGIDVTGGLCYVWARHAKPGGCQLIKRALKRFDVRLLNDLDEILTDQRKPVQCTTAGHLPVLEALSAAGGLLGSGETSDGLRYFRTHFHYLKNHGVESDSGESDLATPNCYLIPARNDEFIIKPYGDRRECLEWAGWSRNRKGEAYTIIGRPLYFHEALRVVDACDYISGRGEVTFRDTDVCKRVARALRHDIKDFPNGVHKMKPVYGADGTASVLWTVTVHALEDAPKGWIRTAQKTFARSIRLPNMARIDISDLFACHVHNGSPVIKTCAEPLNAAPTELYSGEDATGLPEDLHTWVVRESLPAAAEVVSELADMPTPVALALMKPEHARPRIIRAAPFQPHTFRPGFWNPSTLCDRYPVMACVSRDEFPTLMAYFNRMTADLQWGEEFAQSVGWEQTGDVLIEVFRVLRHDPYARTPGFVLYSAGEVTGKSFLIQDLPRELWGGDAVSDGTAYLHKGNPDAFSNSILEYSPVLFGEEVDFSSEKSKAILRDLVTSSKTTFHPKHVTAYEIDNPYHVFLAGNKLDYLPFTPGCTRFIYLEIPAIDSSMSVQEWRSAVRGEYPAFLGYLEQLRPIRERGTITDRLEFPVIDSGLRQKLMAASGPTDDDIRAVVDALPDEDRKTHWIKVKDFIDHLVTRGMYSEPPSSRVMIGLFGRIGVETERVDCERIVGKGLAV